MGVKTKLSAVERLDWGEKVFKKERYEEENFKRWEREHKTLGFLTSFYKCLSS